MCRERTPNTSSGDSCVFVVSVIVGNLPFQAIPDNLDPGRGRPVSLIADPESRSRIVLHRGRGIGHDLHTGRQAAVLPMLLGLVESRVGGVKQLVLLLLDGSGGRGVGADRGDAER